MKSSASAVIQARMGSSRLPGKMLMPIIDGKGPLELMIERVWRAKSIKSLIIATTDQPQDDELAELCEKLNVPFFRGDENDVLDRFYQTALTFPSDILIRLTGDCSLHDPAVIDRAVRTFLSEDCDYAANINPPSYPDGLDVEVFSFKALKKAWEEARLKSEREHVTLFIRNRMDVFKIVNFASDVNRSEMRWTLDEERDLVFIRRVYEKLYRQNPCFGMEEVIRLLEENPEISDVNSSIERDEGLRRSLENDRIVK